MTFFEVADRQNPPEASPEPFNVPLEERKSQAVEQRASQASEQRASQASEQGASQAPEPRASQAPEPRASQASEQGASQASEQRASRAPEQRTGQVRENAGANAGLNGGRDRGQRTGDGSLPSISIQENGQDISGEIRQPGGTIRQTDRNGVVRELDVVNGQQRLLSMRMPGPGGDILRLRYDGASLQPSSISTDTGLTFRAGGENRIQVNPGGVVSISGEADDPNLPGNRVPVSAEWNGITGTRSEQHGPIRAVTVFGQNNDGGIASALPSNTTTTYDDAGGGVQVSQTVRRSDGYQATFLGDPRTLNQHAQAPVPPLGNPYRLAEIRFPPHTAITLNSPGQAPQNLELAGITFPNRPGAGHSIVRVRTADGEREFVAEGVDQFVQPAIRHGERTQQPLQVTNWTELKPPVVRAMQNIPPAQMGAPGVPGQQPQLPRRPGAQ